jgi:hypothetical protein
MFEPVVIQFTKHCGGQARQFLSISTWEKVTRHRLPTASQRTLNRLQTDSQLTPNRLSTDSQQTRN